MCAPHDFFLWDPLVIKITYGGFEIPSAVTRSTAFMRPRGKHVGLRHGSRVGPRLCRSSEIPFDGIDSDRLRHAAEHVCSARQGMYLPVRTALYGILQ